MEKRGLSESEARQVFERAAEIDAVATPESVSVEEIRTVASEAGFSPAVIDQAIAETLRQSGTHQESLVVEEGFVISRFTVSLTMSVTLSENDIRQVAVLSAAYFESDPRVRIGRGHASWKDRRRFRFELSTDSGRTRLTVTSPRLFGQKARWRQQASRAIRRLEAIVSFVTAASAARQL